MFRFFEKLIKPFPVREPGQPPKGLLAFCYHYTRGIEMHLLLMSVLAMAIAIMEVSLFAFLGTLVDWLSSRQADSLLQNEGWRLFWWAVMILVGLPLAILLQSMILHQSLLGNYPMIIRWQAHRYLLGQSFAFYQNEFAGRIATKLMQTSLAVREAVLKLLNVFVYVGVYFTGMVVVVAESDIRLTTPLLVWFVAYIGIMYFFIPRLETISSKQADARSNMTGRLVDTYTNIATVKLFSHSRREADYAQEGMSSFLQTVYSQMRLVTGFIFSVWVINALLIFSVGSLSIWLWTQGMVTVGAIAAAIGLVLRLYGTSQWVMWETSALFENIGTVEDGMGTLSKAQDVRDRPDAKAIEVAKGKIEFDQVSFHYGKGSGVIENFSLSIQPGEKIGFVGRSGSGKSTLVNLLLRFYDVEAGRILIDDQDISQVQQESLRAQIGMVTQDTSLLHRSVGDNIMYGKPDATGEQVIAAARQAKAHEFIQELNDIHGRHGYDAQVGERGVKLSGGQRQRIAIARVLLKDAPILILDEATSALDSEVEAAIQENLYRLMQGKTVIAIAHRLSTIAALDRLVVLDEGRIVEQGKHAELIKRRGLYAQFWAHQSGGFLGDDAE
ncbi:MAG: ABC transporter ATP-binding protein [Gammaproteobacteria bacterium]|nr:ABC transporter ATP-binding protein [Gammaproteobacteria bacterium]